MHRLVIMHIMVIFIKNGGYFPTNSNPYGLSITTIFSKGIIFLILVFPLEVITGVERRRWDSNPRVQGHQLARQLKFQDLEADPF